MITVVTPLIFEASCLRPLAQEAGWNLVVSGPGQAGIDRLETQLDRPPGSVVLLAGLAGGLDPGLETGQYLAACEVQDESGARFKPSLQVESNAGVLLSALEIASTAEQKAHLRRATGADAVDLESGPFARMAEDRGWQWGIVRGISDDAHTGLPVGCEHWIGPAGQARPRAILASIARSPRLLGTLPGLRRKGRQAMHSVAGGLEAVLSNQG